MGRCGTEPDVGCSMVWITGRRLCALAWLVVAVWGTAALAEPYVFPDAWTDTPAAEVRPGGTLRFSNLAAGDPRTFNPLVSVEVNVVVGFNTNPAQGAAVIGWRRPDDGAWEPRAAETWTVSDDGLTIDVLLRPELRWSDGTPISVQDYLISYQLQTHPETGARGLEGWLVDGEPITVEATGERSLRIRFPAPDRLAMLRLAHLYPLPDRIFGEAFRSGGAAAVNALWGIETPPSELVFSGSMRLAGVVLGERLVFERNPYFGDWNVDAAGRPLPYLDGLQFQHLEPDAALNLFLAGELDGFQPRNLDDIGVIQRAVADDGLDAIVVESAFPALTTFFLAFNWNLASDPFKQQLFRNRDFRRAVAHLVDRDAIIDLVHSGAAFPLKGGVHPSSTTWFHDDLAVPEFDPERAATLLAGIGFTRRDAQGYLVDADGRRAGFTVTVVAGQPIAEGTVAIIADTAREAGLDVRTQPVAFPLLVDMLQTRGDDRPFEAIMAGLTARDPAWPLHDELYACDGAFRLYDRSGHCLSATEERIAELVRLGRATLDDEAARRIALEVQELEADVGALIYIVSPAVHLVTSGSVRGYFPPELWGPMYGFGLPFLSSRR
jgi:peptide/nickel transport system substrate-binding protein